MDVQHPADARRGVRMRRVNKRRVNRGRMKSRIIKYVLLARFVIKDKRRSPRHPYNKNEGEIKLMNQNGHLKNSISQFLPKLRYLKEIMHGENFLFNFTCKIKIVVE